MAAAAFSGTDEERAEQALIAAAAKILSSENRGVPEDFVAGLFAYAVPEDLMRYGARELAELAADAWALMSVREPGTPNIRFASPTWRPATRPRIVPTIVPRTSRCSRSSTTTCRSCVDSVLGELAERGIDIRFVVHPVFTVERDVVGRLTAFKGAKPATGGALRESFIHLHIERIDDDNAPRRDRARDREGARRRAALASQDWRAMMARVGEVDRRAQGQSAAAAGRRDRRGHPVPGMAR